MCVPTLQGRVVEYYTGRPVAGAIVVVGNQRALTDANGYFTVSAPLGQVSLRVVHKDFRAFSKAYSLTQNIAYTVGEIRLVSVVRAL